MQDEPTPTELIKAVADFLRNEIAPEISGHNAFKLRVGDQRARSGDAAIGAGSRGATPRKPRGCRNCSAMEGSLGELNRALADGSPSGEIDLQTPGLAEHLWQTTMDKLAVDQPNYASYKRELGTSDSAGSPVMSERDLAASKRWLIRCHRVKTGSGLRSARRHDVTRFYFPSHFGGRFSENAFGPSI